MASWFTKAFRSTKRFFAKKVIPIGKKVFKFIGSKVLPIASRVLNNPLAQAAVGAATGGLGIAPMMAAGSAAQFGADAYKTVNRVVPNAANTMVGAFRAGDLTRAVGAFDAARGDLAGLQSQYRDLRR